MKGASGIETKILNKIEVTQKLPSRTLQKLESDDLSYAMNIYPTYILIKVINKEENKLIPLKMSSGP